MIATAVAAGAELIVSGDRDLLALGGDGNLCIVTPAEAIALLAIA